MSKKKILLLGGFLALLAIIIGFDLQSYFSLEFFQAQRQLILDYKEDNFLLSSLIYFCLYVVVAALSLPAAAILTLIGGSVFGFIWGLVLVSFASTIGATLAFLLARTILRDWVQRKFGNYLGPVNRGIEKDGNFYLFTIRLIPIFPFFLVNALMALTPIKIRSFYIVSQLGMLFGTVLYINLGAQLGLATSVTDIMSIGVIRAIVVLAVFPWLAKATVGFLKRKKRLMKFKKPKRYDANMVVIGAGSAGLVASYIATLLKAKVILIEKHKMGGDCLNTGCVPSKAFIRSASINHMINRARDFGIETANAKVNFQQVMGRVKQVIKTVEPHDSVERYTGLGVEVIEAEAKITSPYTVEVNNREITTRNIVLATGAKPFVPPIPGIDETAYLTSDTVWEITVLPTRLLVMGGGPVGCELAQAFARLGSKVTLVDMEARILPREDEEVSEFVSLQFKTDGIRLLTNHRVKRFETVNNEKVMIASRNDEEVSVGFDQLMLAVGRKANVEGFGLESLDIALNPDGTIQVNEYLQTIYPNIYACGDVAGPYQFTHMASFQAWFASINSLFSPFKKFRVNYSVVPWATFIDPEVARVGLNEADAMKQGIPCEVTRYGIDDLDRAITDGEAKGFVKILTVPGKDKILGATIVGYHAAELITEFVTAMTHGLGLKKIMSTIHIYPTLSESNRFAASEWRKKNVPEWIYPYLEKFHRWRRN